MGERYQPKRVRTYGRDRGYLCLSCFVAVRPGTGQDVKAKAGNCRCDRGSPSLSQRSAAAATPQVASGRAKIRNRYIRTIVLELRPFPVWAEQLDGVAYPVSDVLIVDPRHFGPEQPAPVEGVDANPVEEERPPICPRCHKRLVILTTQWTRDAAGSSLRRQLWGCPRGHATAFRSKGSFSPIELLPDVVR